MTAASKQRPVANGTRIVRFSEHQCDTPKSLTATPSVRRWGRPRHAKNPRLNSSGECSETSAYQPSKQEATRATAWRLRLVFGSRLADSDLSSSGNCEAVHRLGFRIKNA